MFRVNTIQILYFLSFISQIKSKNSNRYFKDFSLFTLLQSSTNVQIDDIQKIRKQYNQEYIQKNSVKKGHVNQQVVNLQVQEQGQYKTKILKVLFVENLDKNQIDQIEKLYNSIKSKEEKSTILRVYDKYYLTTEDGLNLYLIIEYEDTSINLWSYYKFGKNQTLQNSEVFYDFIKNQEKKKTTSQNWWKEYKDYCQSIKLRDVNYNTFEMCIDVFDDTVFDFVSTLSDINSEQMIAEQPIEQDIKDFTINKVNFAKFIWNNVPDLFNLHDSYIFGELFLDNSIDNIQLQEYDEDYFILKAQQNQKNILIKAEKFQSLQDAEISILEYNRLYKYECQIFTNKIQKIIEVNGFTYTILYEDEIDLNNYMTLNQFLKLNIDDEQYSKHTYILNIFLNNLIFFILYDINHMIMDLNTIYIQKQSDKIYFPIKMVFQNPLFMLTKLKQKDQNYFAINVKNSIDEILDSFLIRQNMMRHSIFNNFQDGVFDKYCDQIHKLKRIYINKFFNGNQEQKIKADYKLSSYISKINQYIHYFSEFNQIGYNSSNLFMTSELQLGLSYNPIEFNSEQIQQSINQIMRQMQIIKIKLKQFNNNQIIEFNDKIKSCHFLKKLQIKSNMTNIDDDYEIKTNILKKFDNLSSLIIQYDDKHQSYLNISVLKEKNILSCIQLIFNNDYDFQSEEEQIDYIDDELFPPEINQATQYFQIIEKLKIIKTLKKINIVLDYRMFFSSQEESKNQISDLKEFKLNQQNLIEIKNQKAEMQKQLMMEQQQLANEQTQLYLQSLQDTLFKEQQHQGQTQQLYQNINNQKLMQKENLNPNLYSLSKKQKEWQKLQTNLNDISIRNIHQFHINQTKYEQNQNQDYNKYCVSLFQDTMPVQENVEMFSIPKVDLFNQGKILEKKKQITKISLTQNQLLFKDKTNQLLSSGQKISNNSDPNQNVLYNNGFTNSNNEFEFQKNIKKEQIEDINLLPNIMEAEEINLEKSSKKKQLNFDNQMHFNEIQNKFEQEMNQSEEEKYQPEHEQDEFEQENKIELEEDYVNSINTYFFQFDNNMNNIIAQNIQQKLITDIQQILNANNQIIIRGIKNGISQLILQFQHTQMHNIGSLKLYFTIIQDTLKISKVECRSIDKLLCLKYGEEIIFGAKLIQLWIKAELQTDLIYDLIGSDYVPQCFHCDYNLVQSNIYKYQQNIEKLRIGIMLCQHSVFKNKISLNFIDYEQSKFNRLIQLSLIFKAEIQNYQPSIKVLKKQLKEIPNLLKLMVSMDHTIEDFDDDIDMKLVFQSLKKLNRLVCFQYY